jgi:hypothetical protein
VQNEEQQSPTALWSKVNSKSDYKPRDQLYVEYSFDEFKGLKIDKTTDPELFKFIEDVQNNGPRFYGYTLEQLEKFSSKIYELRKNNSNNPT